MPMPHVFTLLLVCAAAQLSMSGTIHLVNDEMHVKGHRGERGAVCERDAAARVPDRRQEEYVETGMSRMPQ